MVKIVQNCFKVKKMYGSGFRPYMNTVFIYACLSSLWVLFSDRLFMAMAESSNMYRVLQSVKGIGFVLITSILLMTFLYKNYLQMVNVKEAYEKSEDNLKRLMLESHENQELYRLMAQYLTDEELSAKDVMIGIFRFVFDKVKECDLGSVYLLADDYVHFMDVVGYDLKSLNEMQMETASFDLHTFAIRRNTEAEKALQRRMEEERYRFYRARNPVIHESVYIGLFENEQARMGISLDISEEKYRSNTTGFQESTLEELKEIQVLLTAMFRMKSIFDVKDIIQRDIVMSFITALEMHDEYTKGHSESVAAISMDIGRRLKLSTQELNELNWAALVHDIGKIIVPGEILNKRGPLADEEYDLVKRHTTTGESFLSKSESLTDIARYVRHHHERWDGKGYPDGLLKEEIPLYSRIICVADSYHAMTSDRPYRKGMTAEAACREIKKNAGAQFCPTVAEAFLEGAKAYHLNSTDMVS